MDAMRRRYGRWLLFAMMLAGTAGVGGLVLVNFSTPPPPADAVDRLETIQLGMSPDEVSDVMDGPGIVQSRNVACTGPGVCFSNETYDVGNGWTIEASFHDLKLTERSFFYPRKPPWYSRAWQSLQNVIPSLPDAPF